MKNIYSIHLPGTHPLDIIGPAQLFYECIEYGVDLHLHFVSSTLDNELKSSIGLGFSKLIPYKHFELSKGDIIVVPGIEFSLFADEVFQNECQDFYAWLNRQHKQKATIVSVCTGAFVLAQAGLLNGLQATTHWKSFDVFEMRYPEIELVKNRLFVENEYIFTSAGMLSGIDLCLYLVEKEYGTKFAIKIAKEIVIYFRRSGSDPQLSIFLQFRNHLDTRIHDAQDFVEVNLGASFTIEKVADHVNMSSRNLTRLFKKTTGITLGDYLTKLRIERSIQLLAEGHTLDFVAHKCGLKSTNQLRTLLKKHQEILPVDPLNIK
jgi:transcriptional regulator GlxA family with amidase domain